MLLQHEISKRIQKTVQETSMLRECHKADPNKFIAAHCHDSWRESQNNWSLNHAYLSEKKNTLELKDYLKKELQACFKNKIIPETFKCIRFSNGWKKEIVRNEITSKITRKKTALRTIVLNKDKIESRMSLFSPDHDKIILLTVSSILLFTHLETNLKLGKRKAGIHSTNIHIVHISRQFYDYFTKIQIFIKICDTEPHNQIFDENGLV
uniref:Uncharacterized protein n=1 Tax=Onchocerca volvulus TaxID=6282 RepID=A0A8R1TLQ2_ONCVO